MSVVALLLVLGLCCICLWFWFYLSLPQTTIRWDALSGQQAHPAVRTTTTLQRWWNHSHEMIPYDGENMAAFIDLPALRHILYLQKCRLVCTSLDGTSTLAQRMV